MTVSTADHLDRVLRRVQEFREAGQRIAFTNGCFDILHPGHLDSLSQARALADRLVVAVNSDESVRRLKGPGRPILPLQDRLDLLAALRWVDEVVPFDEDTPIAALRAVRPDVLVKGADWTVEELEGADEVRAWGGEVRLLELVPGHSTTRIIEAARGLRRGGC